MGILTVVPSTWAGRLCGASQSMDKILGYTYTNKKFMHDPRKNIGVFHFQDDLDELSLALISIQYLIVVLEKLRLIRIIIDKMILNCHISQVSSDSELQTKMALLHQNTQAQIIKK